MNENTTSVVPARHASSAHDLACRTCGSANKKGARFCAACGASIESTSAVIPDSGELVEWHYECNGERLGPVTETKISQLIACGTLDRESLVWNESCTAWLKLADTNLATGLQRPPPLPGQAVSNGIIWVLAFAPLIGQFLEGFIWGLTGIGLENLWWITLCLNIGLSCADEQKLKKAGHDTDSMGGAWLVPVYLFNRAKVLKHSNAYFIVWLVGFALVLLGIW